ncbi:DUF402 domain-containing protein [Micromonospora sp. NPDC050417]|uniref:DUF402 domain-containing protein n=1 Tax=Micromonospora sp. NPDC050417 TaxID=3364280 RepID=UPI0037A3226B
MHRNVRRGRIGWVRPATVVSDDDRGLLLWIGRGTPVAHEVADDGRGMRAMPFTEWLTRSYQLATGVWAGPPLLMFLPAGADHSVWWFRDGATDRFTHWYVNLEEHAQRWDDGAVAGVDMVDQDLDILVQPDLTWCWKDEEEFAERLAHPEGYWVPDEAAVRAEGLRVVATIESGGFPFDGTWCDLVPDPAWTIPAALPAGWNRPPVR